MSESRTSSNTKHSLLPSSPSHPSSSFSRYGCVWCRKIIYCYRHEEGDGNHRLDYVGTSCKVIAMAICCRIMPPASATRIGLKNSFLSPTVVHSVMLAFRIRWRLRIPGVQEPALADTSAFAIGGVVLDYGLWLAV